MTKINMTVDGVAYTDDVEPRTLLVHYLREQLGKVGTVVGCDTSNCGACTVDLDGESVKSCTVLAVQADGSTVTTIEGLAGTHPVQQAWIAEQVTMCGYCEPGFIMAIAALLKATPSPSGEQIAALPNICRCGAYVRIRKAIARAAQTAAPLSEPRTPAT